MKAVLFGVGNGNLIPGVFSKFILSNLERLVTLYKPIINRENIQEHQEFLKNAEIAFSTWGMPLFSEEEIHAYMPCLKILFYAAGSVQYFARPFLHQGVRVISGWGANAVPVAEYSVAQIILANKGFYQSSLITRTNYKQARVYFDTFPGNYAIKVGILGAGMIGTKVIQLLKSYHLQLMVYDPFLSEERTQELNITKNNLHDIFSSCQTISNHLANNSDTVGILHGEHFTCMLPNATFINTGRGAQVVEEDLIQALKEQPSRTAVLDVTWPEPPDVTSELLHLPNVFLTPHIAGSSGKEVERMAEYMFDDYMRYINGTPLLYEVTLKMLSTMA